MSKKIHFRFPYEFTKKSDCGTYGIVSPWPHEVTCERCLKAIKKNKHYIVNCFGLSYEFLEAL